jgi:hypothetical protein
MSRARNEVFWESRARNEVFWESRAAARSPGLRALDPAHRPPVSHSSLPPALRSPRGRTWSAWLYRHRVA